MKIKKGYNALDGLLEDVVATLNAADGKYIITIISSRHYAEIENANPSNRGGTKHQCLSMVVYAHSTIT